ncbi:MAG: PilZ domain-containing protein [Candidatus Omnitrophica bacterium]|nr:PilZ domain-containing protein [Candidatus Omnitrophota bacterium]
MAYTGPERRKHPRINGRFVVSYRLVDEEDNVDVSQTRNLSLGGMLLTTNTVFQPGVNLALEMRLPFFPHPISVIAKVIESKEIVKDLIYDTRLTFISTDEKYKKIISETVECYLKKGQ